jgi:methyl-accepting chemotaxis protein
MRKRILFAASAAIFAAFLALDAAVSFSGAFGIASGRAGLLILLAVSQLALLSLLSLFFVRVVLRKFDIVESSITNIAEGVKDLTLRLELKRDPMVKGFARVFNIFIAEIHNLVLTMKILNRIQKGTSRRLETSASEISVATEQIAANIQSMKGNEETLHSGIETAESAVAEIRGTTKDVVERIGYQADSLARSVSEIAEMIRSIGEIRDIAAAKNELIERLRDSSSESSASMRASLETITQISSSIDTINAFTLMINQIASQTNLLAMNAAIEAAHAGEFGRGFSVVADEIRKLAETTAANSKSISSSLRAMVAQINRALELTRKADASILSVDESIAEVAQGVGEIIKGIGQVSEGSERVTSSLGELNDVSSKVQAASSRISGESERIERSMTDVTGLSAQNTRAMAEVNAGVRDLVRSMAEIKELGVDNERNVAILEAELGQFATIDVSRLKSGDGQDLIVWAQERKTVPPRPAEPEKFPESDSRHWYDYEFAGWNIAKERLPVSDAEGARGKRIVAIDPVYHDYYIAHARGMKTISEFFGVELEVYPAPKKDAEAEQRRQVAKAISSRPDLIIFAATEVKSSAELVKQIYDAGIPVIAATTMPSAEAFKYILGYTGTDEWGSFRLLARRLAETLQGQGGYGVLQHVPGGGPFYARNYAALTELSLVAPNMKCLETAYTEFDRAKTKAAVSEWVRRHGDLPAPGERRGPACRHGGRLFQWNRLRADKVSSEQAHHQGKRRRFLPGSVVMRPSKAYT